MANERFSPRTYNLLTAGAWRMDSTLLPHFPYNIQEVQVQRIALIFTDLHRVCLQTLWGLPSARLSLIDLFTRKTPPLDLGAAAAFFFYAARVKNQRRCLNAVWYWSEGSVFGEMLAGRLASSSWRGKINTRLVVVVFFFFLNQAIPKQEVVTINSRDLNTDQ